jgi:hypothetical protein
MLTGYAPFPGVRNRSDQLKKIFSSLGTPTEETWPGIGECQYFKNGTFRCEKMRPDSMSTED